MTKIKELKMDYWANILIYIHDNDYTISNKIQQRIGYTYSCIVNIIQLLEDKKFIIRKKEGRNKIITITTKGKAMAEHLKQIIKILKEGIK